MFWENWYTKGGEHIIGIMAIWAARGNKEVFSNSEVV